LSEIDGDFQANIGSSGYQDSWQPQPIVSTAAQSDEPRYVPDLNEGDSVRHKIFGVGTVVELQGETAVVFFKGKGARTLNISFAPIEKL
jgi:hypothetical protein